VGDTGKVIGVDMIKDIIRRAGSLADERGVKKVDFGLGEIESWPNGDSPVDVAISK
jgi:arsenite methyltransferase